MNPSTAWIMFTRLADQRLHFVDCLLLGGIAYAAGIEQNLSLRFVRGHRIALSHELRGTASLSRSFIWHP